MQLQRMGLVLAAACAAGLAACGGGDGDRITIDLEFTGDGVETATIIVAPTRAGGESFERIDPDTIDPLAVNVVEYDPWEFTGREVIEAELPWSRTITVDEEEGGFSVIAINSGESGTIACDAEWNQAFDDDGTWSRSDEYLVGCSAEASFGDDDLVRLDPGGRSVSFAARDEAVAEIQAEVAVEEARVEPPVRVRLPDGGLTGNRNATEGAARLTAFDTDFELEVVDASVNDVEALSIRLGVEVDEPSGDRAYVMVDVALTHLDPQGFGPVGPDWTAEWRLESGDGTTVYDDTDRCPNAFSVFTAEPAPEGGVDWNYSDDHLLAFPNETKVFAACFEVDPADVEGSVLVIAELDQEVELFTGL